MEDIVQYQLGDVVFCREDLFNDGGLPGYEEGALIAAAGTRGVVVQFGHVEAMPSEEIYLVRFEGEGQDLGLPIGCLPEELTQDEAEAAELRATH
ncbi:MAG: nitrogen fixation protein NifZ [Proteobacteria bacterium]|nr:nitrogen fixation protein NifZ [Pseudomonadota bacterium]RTL29084.1 MAG: nitrogen fixation protein NifZ [Rhodocyclaceae bacterium]